MPDTIKSRTAALAARTPATYATNSAFYHGDHWQAGAGWSGTLPEGDENAALAATTLLAQVGRLFVASNVIGEIVDRFASTLIGREPQWSLDPRDPNLFDLTRPQTDEEKLTQTMIDETNNAMTSFWDSPSKHVMAHLLQTATDAALNGQAYLRLFIPDALIKDGVIVTDLTFARAVESIWIESVPAHAIAHIRNKITMDTESDRAYIVKDADGKDEQRIEHQRIIRMVLQRNPETDQMEMMASYQGEPLTIIEILQQIGDEITGSKPIGLPLRGHLLTFELAIKGQIDDPIRRLQRALNVVLTMQQHNILGAGFFERVMLNAQMPGTWVKAADPSHPAAVNGWILKPGSYATGLGVVNNLVGQPIKGEKGETTGYTTPSIWTHEPSPTDTFTNSQEAYYTQMLKSAGQLHAILSGDAVASGVSRQQALTDFLARIAPAAAQVQTMVRWLLETIAYLAGYLSNDDQQRHILKATVKLRLALPPISADEQRVLGELMEKGIISEELGLGQLPYVDDPESEMTRKAQERAGKAVAMTGNLAAGMLAALETSNSGNGLTAPSLNGNIPTPTIAPVATTGNTSEIVP